MANYMEKVNLTRIAPDLFEEVVAMVACMPEAERASFEVRTFHVLELLKRKGLRGDMVVAINFRLEALARLQNEVELHGWTMPGDAPGQVFIHADVVRAAAEEPMTEDDGAATFNQESFCRRVLANTEAKGRA